MIASIMYKQGSIIARDFVLSMFTMANYDGPNEAPSTGPDTRPLNRKHIDGVSFLGEWAGGQIFMALFPKEEYGPPNVNALKYWLFWNLFLNNLFYTIGRLLGCFLGLALGGGLVDPETWFKDFHLKLLRNTALFPLNLYLSKEGKTDDGKYNPTGVPYKGYPSKDDSPYVLPYAKDKTYYVIQGNQGMFSHYHNNLDQTYSYDFSAEQDEHVLAARPGTVVDFFDWVPDDTDPDNAQQTAAETEAKGVIVPPLADQTMKDSWNFIAIRHDCDDAKNPLPPNNNHDKAAGGSVITTYAIYGHGRKGSVRKAFAALTPSIAPNDIIGQQVKQGQHIMDIGDTGVSFNNHLHMMVQEGPAAPAPGRPRAAVSRFNLQQPTLPFVFKEHGVLKKLDWYTSATVEVP